MKSFLAALAAMFCLIGPARANDHPTQKQAMAITQKAAAFLKENGKDKLVAAINAKDPDFVQGELYVVALDLEGHHLAHPYNPKLIGQALLDQPDPDGKLFRKDRVEQAKANGRGWVDYKYKNPVNGQLEQKTAYVLKVGDVILSAGSYKDAPEK